MRKFPWMVEVARQRPMNILHPYIMEVYVARDEVGGVSLPHPAQGFLRPKQRGEGGQARTRV